VFAMFELAGTPACDPLSGTVEIAYTAYHPHLRSVSLHVRSNDSTYSHFQVDAPPPAGGVLPISGNTNPAVTQTFNPLFTITPALTHQCAYLATMTVVPRLHNGESDHDGVQPPQLVFFWS
jgi:hypothetical protein